MVKNDLILHSPYLQWLLAQLFPRLRQWPIGKWPDMLARARQIGFDRVEQYATMAAVIVLAFQIKPLLALDLDELFAYLTQFAMLLPVLALLVVPFLIRRIRRGLDAAADGEPAARE